MKKIVACVTLLAALMIKPVEATSTKGKGISRIDNTRELYFDNQVFIQTGARARLNFLTVYNPEARQCDRTPLVTASNSKINVTKLRSGQIRWMALSRDLLKRWNGQFHYGDTVWLKAGDPTIDGFWIIKDTMNKRFRKYGDLLFDGNIRRHGKWKNVEIFKIKNSPVRQTTWNDFMFLTSNSLSTE
ncbi:MAG TPA: hypothetical protein VGK39_05100 [Cyclobacteriaceae bacterium]